MSVSSGFAVIFCMIFLLCASSGAQKPGPMDATSSTVEIRFVLQVPEGTTGTVYITGSVPELGAWQPGAVAMSGTGTERVYVARVPRGTPLEYKFTLGSWAQERLNAHGMVEDNFRAVADKDQTVHQQAYGFGHQRPDSNRKAEGQVTGNVKLWKDVASRYLKPTRDVIIWLPPDYETSPTRRYPVLYMHDGQNIIDPRTSSMGVDWAVDDSLTSLIQQGRVEPVIVVGAYCTDRRREEYDPDGEGEQYARFLIEELMPRVNHEFRTLTGPQNTGVMGSSMGAIISVYLGWKHPELFGKVGALSVAFLYRKGLFLSELETSAIWPRGVKTYFDCGTVGGDRDYAPYCHRFEHLLRTRGLESGRDYMFFLDEGADHNERAWRNRLGRPLEFLFGVSAKSEETSGSVRAMRNR